MRYMENKSPAEITLPDINQFKKVVSSFKFLGSSEKISLRQSANMNL